MTRMIFGMMDVAPNAKQKTTGFALVNPRYAYLFAGTDKSFLQKPVTTEDWLTKMDVVVCAISNMAFNVMVLLLFVPMCAQMV